MLVVGSTGLIFPRMFLRAILLSVIQSSFSDIFSLGFGPFRWVCTSGLHSDLIKTDEIAMNVLKDIIKGRTSMSRHVEAKSFILFPIIDGIPTEIEQQYSDNLRWLREADRHKLVVGSQARILYSDQQGRVAIALAFNKAVKEGLIKVKPRLISFVRIACSYDLFQQSPIVISRDHHDVSGTDSPFRETSNVTDGSAFTAGANIGHNLISHFALETFCKKLVVFFAKVVGFFGGFENERRAKSVSSKLFGSLKCSPRNEMARKYPNKTGMYFHYSVLCGK